MNIYVTYKFCSVWGILLEKKCKEQEIGHSFKLSESGFNWSRELLGIKPEQTNFFFYSTGKLVTYDVINNRWCENIGRAHKSNNVM